MRKVERSGRARAVLLALAVGIAALGAGCEEEQGSGAPAWKVGQDCAALVTDAVPQPRVCGLVSKDATTGHTTTAVLACGPEGTWMVAEICVETCEDREDGGGPRCSGKAPDVSQPDAGGGAPDVATPDDAPLAPDAP